MGHTLPVTACTGTASSSEQELYHLLHQDKSRLLGLVSPKAATADDVQQLLQHAAALSSALNAQAGNGCELVVASSIWTKNWPINPDYAAAVKELFQVGLASITNFLLILMLLSCGLNCVLIQQQ
jgi:hypothetical protein